MVDNAVEVANGPSGIGGSRNQNPLNYINNNQHPVTFNHLAVGKGGIRIVNGGSTMQAGTTNNFDKNTFDRSLANK